MFKNISSKKQVIIILLIFVIPLIGFFIFYNLITVSVVNKRIAQSNQSTINIYQEVIGNELDNIEEFMIDLIANNPDYQQLRNKRSQLDAHLNSYEILNKYKTILNVHPMIGGMMIHSETNQVFRSTYNEGFTYEFKYNLEEYVKEITLDEENCNTREWFTKKVDNQYFLFRILGNKGTHTICVVKLNDIKSINEFNRDAEGFILFSTNQGDPLTMIKQMEAYGIDLKANKDSYYVTGIEKKYFVVQNELKDLNINMVYIVPHHGVLYYMDQAQMLLIIASVLIIILIPVCYRMLQYSYFRPLEQLVKTMKQIKDGKLDAKMEEQYSIKEFKQFSDTFNEMMEQIHFFKISAYENELELQRAQLQYLQIQIRPHFFLNCLKNIYGMAQEEKREEIQEIILSLSVYFRYMFRDSFELVPLSNEVENVKSYINLHKLIMSNEISVHIDISKEVLDFKVPPISILTFVENSIKHGVYLNHPLKIYIKVRLLISEEGEYVNITVSDNGKGFSEDALLKLNSKDDKNNTSEHIGISNVKHRFSLIYDNKSTISFSNQANGACVEVFIPCNQEN